MFRRRSARPLRSIIIIAVLIVRLRACSATSRYTRYECRNRHRRTQRQATAFGAGAVLLGLLLAATCVAPFSAQWLRTLSADPEAGVVPPGARSGSICCWLRRADQPRQRCCFGVGASPPHSDAERGVPYLLSRFSRGLLAACVGAVVAVPAMQLKSLYLAIATLGFGVVLQKIIFEWRGLTNGGGGLALSPPVIAG